MFWLLTSFNKLISAEVLFSSMVLVGDSSVRYTEINRFVAVCNEVKSFSSKENSISASNVG